MNPMNDDRALMRRIRHGDEAAFTELVTRHGGRMQGVARRLLGSRADAEDAVQRAFLRCYTHAADYRPEWAVSTWLYRILTNLCVDEMRRRSARTARDPEALGDHEIAGRRRRATAPGQHLDLRRALLRVPREARVLLALRYMDGLTYEELARVRGISVNTVKSQLARGKSILRAALGAGYHNGLSTSSRSASRRMEHADAEPCDG